MVLKNSFIRLMAFLCVIMFFGGSGGFVFAAETPDQPSTAVVLSKVSAFDCHQLLLEMGFLGTEIDDEGDIMVPRHDYKTLLIVGRNKGLFLQFRFAVSGSHASLETVNTWNRKMRFSRAYLEEDNTVVLESDQDLTGGITRERLRDFIQTYHRSLEDFIQEIS